MLDLAQAGAVEVAVHLGPLGELVALGHRQERGAVDEVVFAPVDLVGARFAGGVRDREPELGVALGQDARLQRRLAGPGGRRNNEQHEIRVGAHSTFCTCSRILSISALSSTTAWAIAKSCDLAPIVFISRAISCKRKSSRRPVVLPWQTRFARWPEWISSRVSSSEMSDRSSKRATSCSSRAGSTAAQRSPKSLGLGRDDLGRALADLARRRSPRAPSIRSS